MTFIEEKIRVSCENLSGKIVTEKMKITDMMMTFCDYKTSNTPPDENADWVHFGGGEIDFGSIDRHCWFKFSLDLPEIDGYHEQRLMTSGSADNGWDANNPQCTLFIDGDSAYQAFDTNHRSTPIVPGHHDVFVYFYNGMNSPTVSVNFYYATVDLRIEKLYYDLYVPYSALRALQRDSAEYLLIRSKLNEATMLLDFRYPYSDDFYNSIAACDRFMREEFYEKELSQNVGEIDLIGHTHIDVAWLWTIAQTKEKAQRSFSTAVKLMEKYPDYIFQSSQPQLYAFVKENDPGLYSRIKKLAAEGRWEVEGAMWLESDTNLVSGESLVRQILLGKKFMREEFGVESRVLWLPDVFGYSAALPQILKKSGVPFFFTSKISWSETNKFPHDNFIWQGIDGSEIFAVLSQAYVKELDPSSVKASWRDHVEKEYSDTVLSTFGYGDGGGGPTVKMLENYERLKKGIPGLPTVKMRRAGETIEQIEHEFKDACERLRFVPKWSGELYLEMHRGTYTSAAHNKKNNRRSEILYQNVETASVIDCLLGHKSDYPADMLDKNWHTILKNQFHDIIPGSSIGEVYKVSDAEYKELLSEGGDELDRRISSIASSVKSDGGLFVYNPTPFDRTEYLTTDGDVFLAENVPAHGWSVLSPTAAPSDCKAGEKVLENSMVKVVFDDKFGISSIFDKRLGRELVEQGKRANELLVFEDYPREYDAWEITEYYKLKKWIVDSVESVEYERGDTYAAVKITRKYMTSRIEQRIVLHSGSPRLDFETYVDWHEDHVLLKAAFPTTVRSDSATYEIHFGHINRPTHRNTSWDEAKFEVSAHKWADLSEHGFGISLLNDCKYGHSVEENVMTLSLLKAATNPNPTSDRGEHYFTYSIYPHDGSVADGGTIKEAYALNDPLITRHIEQSTEGKLPESYAFVSSSYEGFAVETIKAPEYGEGIIVRGYEAYNGKSGVKLTFGFDVDKVYVCDLMENCERELSVNGRSVEFDVTNFEIVTLRVIAK